MADQIRVQRKDLAGRFIFAFGVLVVVGALVPATPATASPVPASVNLTAASSNYGHDGTFYAEVIPSDGAAPVATGTVVFTEGPLELARATVIPWGGNHAQARLVIATEPLTTRTITATYLGSADISPAAATMTLTTGAASVSATPTDGSITMGTVTFVLGPTSTSDAAFDPLTRQFSMDRVLGPELVATVDVPGTGPTTIAVRISTFQYGMNATAGADGILTFSLGQPIHVQILRITVGGVTWAANCPFGSQFDMTGTVSATEVAISGSSQWDITTAQSCGGFGPLLLQMLGGPATVALRVSGEFLGPPPPGTPTNTTVRALPGTTFTLGQMATLLATVDVPAGYNPAGGTVEVRDNGALVATERLGQMNGPTSDAVIEVLLDVAGPHRLTATYTGYMSGGVTLLIPSTDSVDVDVAFPPAGAVAFGRLTTGSRTSIELPPSTRLVGAEFDSATGAIGPSSFWMPRGGFTLATGLGSFPVRYSFAQLGDMTGQVAPDGTVVLSPTTFTLTGEAVDVGTGWYTLFDCAFGPIPVTFTGTADAGGLHLSADGITIPPVADSGCATYAPAVNPEISGTANLTFEVEGDFARADGTPLEAVSWYPTVDQYNQSFLSAAVDSGDATPTPTGEVTFRDGPTVLGTAPIDETGHAGLVVALDQPGTRTITAAYPGDANHAAGSDTTTVEVTPAPVGYTMDGTITVAGTDIDIAAGSQLLPQTPAPGGPGGPATAANGHDTLAGALAASSAAMWFMPTTITIDTPTYGTVDAEVRLNQYGALAPASIGSAGTIDGLAGTFVLQVRTVTTTAGTTTPIGCVNLVMFAFDGTLSFTDITIDTTGGGTGRIPWNTCTGAGREVIDQLTGGTTTATIHATL